MAWPDPVSDPVLRFAEEGIFCPAGSFHVDPWRPVPRAVITHAHADHARPGMGAYLCTPLTAAVLRHRLGDVRVEVLDYGEARQIGGSRVSFHPAGHVPGSAQVRVEVAGRVWVVSGDYKTEADGLAEPFEPVRCHAFVTECTFGLPVFRWRPQAEVMAEVCDWWRACAAEGRVAMLGAYSLGKAQRLLAALPEGPGPILTHGAVEGVSAVLRDAGLPLPPTIRVTPDLDPKAHPGALVIAPPGALGPTWARRFGATSTAFASGWMALRGIRRRRAGDRGFTVSDHADFAGLTAAVLATGCEDVFTTHGYTSSFSRWLEERGLRAGIVRTEYAGEDIDAAPDPEGAA